MKWATRWILHTALFIVGLAIFFGPIIWWCETEPERIETHHQKFVQLVQEGKNLVKKGPCPRALTVSLELQPYYRAVELQGVPEFALVRTVIVRQELLKLCRELYQLGAVWEIKTGYEEHTYQFFVGLRRAWAIGYLPEALRTAGIARNQAITISKDFLGDGAVEYLEMIEKSFP